VSFYDKVIAEGKNKEAVSSALKNRGLIALDRKEEAKTVELFGRLIHEFPGKGVGPDIYAWLAEYYYKQKQAGNVLKVVEAAGVEADKNPGLMFFSGEARRENGDCERAVTDYQKAVDIGGKDKAYAGASLIGKAACFEIRGMFDDARKSLEDVLKVSSDDDTLVMRARYELGQVESSAGRFEEAYKYYMLVTILYSDDEVVPDALFHAGEMAEKLGKNDDAQKNYAELVQRFPTNKNAETARQKITLVKP
jgi:tetratricopeptide (TPR) repeat protein